MSPNFNTSRVFRERLLPPTAELVGDAALVQAYAVDAPVRQASCVVPTSIRETRRKTTDWVILGRRVGGRMRPDPTLAGHLTFALRHESLDFLLLKRIFDAVPAGGVLPRKRRTKEFADLSDNEVKEVEDIVRGAFGLPEGGTEASREDEPKT
jgi:hypothetical protein